MHDAVEENVTVGPDERRHHGARNFLSLPWHNARKKDRNPREVLASSSPGKTSEFTKCEDWLAARRLWHLIPLWRD